MHWNCSRKVGWSRFSHIYFGNELRSWSSKTSALVCPYGVCKLKAVSSWLALIFWKGMSTAIYARVWNAIWRELTVYPSVSPFTPHCPFSAMTFRSIIDQKTWRVTIQLGELGWGARGGEKRISLKKETVGIIMTSCRWLWVWGWTNNDK